MLVNKPCLIEANLTENWKCLSEWIDHNGSPNFEFLKRHFGNSVAPVADCNEQYFNAQKKQNMRVTDFIDYWQKFALDGHPKDRPCLYLKDWHFVKEYPDYGAYHWPEIFRSDWLNEFCDSENGGDDYKFVYMGPKGSWTPMHADVLSSFSWSSNICGRKKWILFPPGTEENLKSTHGDLPFQRNLSPEMTRGGIIIDQLAGQTIFVPSGWHHQVWNEEDTISINHNWLNGCCIEDAWRNLLKGLRAVENELQDCKDMEGWLEQCQVVLKAVAGVDCKGFAGMLAYIANQRIARIKKEEVQLGKEHTIFDLRKVLNVLESFRQNDILNDVDTCDFKIFLDCLEKE
ncbi:Hypothetical predicted protein [Cloeon dipterum]|uniref:Jumonji domain-containing protein 4 n=1 Tax=Cloeon dipterum TaxID=197152 RepID=A0A8S1C1Z3_9INSE|nr:Hypothetical predicted protein [Cloeon dipterum]